MKIESEFTDLVRDMAKMSLVPKEPFAKLDGKNLAPKDPAANENEVFVVRRVARDEIITRMRRLERQEFMAKGRQLIYFDESSNQSKVLRREQIDEDDRMDGRDHSLQITSKSRDAVGSRWRA